MSIEIHPNINAAGLATDIIKSIVKHSRGDMKGTKALRPEIMQAITQFCARISMGLDILAERDTQQQDKYTAPVDKPE